MTEAEIGGAVFTILGIICIALHRRIADQATTGQDEMAEDPFIAEFERRQGALETRRFNRLFVLGVGILSLGIGLYALVFY